MNFLLGWKMRVPPWLAVTRVVCWKRRTKGYLTLLLWLVAISTGLYWLLTRGESDTRGKRLFQVHHLVNNLQGGQGVPGNNNYMFLEDAEVIPEGLLQPEALEKKRKEREEVMNLLRVAPMPPIVKKGVDNQLRPIRPFQEPNNQIDRLCNRPEMISAGEEYTHGEEYTLEALIILFRHGDRGPLSHVGPRNTSHVNCSAGYNQDFDHLLRFASPEGGMTRLPGFSQFIGPFHAFPRVPTNAQCLLGQLTQQGSAQLIRLGASLYKAYENSPLLSQISVLERNYSSSGFPRLIAYSTRYRRTFQSLISFLWGFFGDRRNYIVSSVSIRESQSINFCFNDCSCRGANRLKKFAQAIGKHAQAKKVVQNPEADVQKHKLAMSDLLEQINSIVDAPGVANKQGKSGKSLLDLLLVYYCHRTELPCTQPLRGGVCLTPGDLASLVSLLQREGEFQKGSDSAIKFSLLSAYGLLKEILSLALKMTSAEASARIALFSGHDTTFNVLTGALGLTSNELHHPDVHFPPYSSRFIFEFYRKSQESGGTSAELRSHYFRVIFNGVGVTQHVSFCRKDGIGTEYCPLESLVRFLHEHYFEPFGNFTNLRDACLAASNGELNGLGNSMLNKKKKKK